MRLLPLLLLLPLAACGNADSGEPAAAGDAALRADLAERLGVFVDDIRESPVDGLYEVRVGPRIAYVSADGAYLVAGNVIRLDDNVNLTEDSRVEARAAWLAGIGEEQMIVFEPRGGTRHTLTVFTDVDCSYCRAMHREIGALLDAGVRVRYLLYPREGPQSPGVARHDRIWCAADRRDALTRAKMGEAIEAPDCETPVHDNLALGAQLPVTGTPAVITDRGELLPGYVPARQLIQRLGGGGDGRAAER